MRSTQLGQSELRAVWSTTRSCGWSDQPDTRPAGNGGARERPVSACLSRIRYRLARDDHGGALGHRARCLLEGDLSLI
jgi:hypothetical protein